MTDDTKTFTREAMAQLVEHLALYWLAERGGRFSIPEQDLRANANIQIKIDEDGVAHFTIVKN